jgi:hypothetical protein
MKKTEVYRGAGLLTLILLVLAGVAPGDGGGGGAGLTYSRDVAPIFYQHCTECHRPGQVAPMTLISYEDVRPWVKSIRKSVSERTMPPWIANPKIGHFKETRLLDDSQIDRIVAWADSDAPEGDPADLPPAPVYPTGWILGEPDEVIEFEPFSIAADAESDNVFEVPALTGMNEDRYVTGVEVICEPQNLVHHVILYIRDDRKRMAGPYNWLYGWGPGTPPTLFDEGTGRLLKKGARVIANIHLTPRGEGGQTRIKAGLHYAPDGVQVAELENRWVMNPTFAVPPGEPNYPMSAHWTLPFDADLYRVFPHMHYRGKDMKMAVHFPDGRSQDIIEVQWDNDWQYSYTLVEPLRLPRGTRFEVTGHYDNSANNPVNPDPTQTVRWAVDVNGEMFVGMIDYVRLAAVD